MCEEFELLSEDQQPAPRKEYRKAPAVKKRTLTCGDCGTSATVAQHTRYSRGTLFFLISGAVVGLPLIFVIGMLGGMFAGVVVAGLGFSFPRVTIRRCRKCGWAQKRVKGKVVSESSGSARREQSAQEAGQLQ